MEGHDHSGSVDEAALIVIASGILCGGDGDVWRVGIGAISCPVSTGDEHRVIRMIQTRAVSVAASDTEKLCQTFVNRAQRIGTRLSSRKDSHPARSSDRDRKAISRYLFSTGDETPAVIVADLRVSMRHETDKQECYARDDHTQQQNR